MFQAVGATAILPQLLAALGALFTVAGVGDIYIQYDFKCNSRR